MARTAPKDAVRGEHPNAPGTWNRLAAVLASVLLLALATQAAWPGTIERRGGFREMDVAAEEAMSGIQLPDVLIVAGSDSVSVDGRGLTRNVDYALDLKQGKLTVFADVPEGARVLITYKYLPFGLARVQAAAALDSLAALPPGFAERAQLMETPAERSRGPSLGPGLTVGGAKTFGITVGSNRDASLEQSLRLNVTGNITRDVSVKAYLSDQNTPLTPEGDTEELRALDQVLVEIEGENVSATMGDYVLEMDGGPLARLRREESGAMARATLGPLGLTLAGARSEGRFMSVSMRGVEGKQGAYLLTDESGATGITVVAGSERVWLNGRRLTRGRDNDYVIDYVGGAIEFTEKRPIDNESDITVDYEYATEEYRRDTYAGRAVFGNESRFVGLSFFRESDDADAPQTTGFTEDELATLAAAGDDPELAHDDGIDSVGVGNGDYVLLGDGVFEYASPDPGDYDLHFEREAGGDYVFNYLGGYYTYVGLGEGDYVLGRSLPLPTDHGLLVADGVLGLPREGLVTASAAVSSYDRNKLSELGDDDNLGNAEILSASLPDVAGNLPGGARVGLRLDGRRVAGGFRGVGRFREVGYIENWELSGLSLPESEAMVRGGTTVSLPSGGSAEVSFARLERGDAVSSTKTEANLSGRPTEGGRVWADGRFVDLTVADPDSERGRTRRYYRGGFEQNVGVVRPGVRYAHDERTTGPSGERYDEYAASLANARPGPFDFGVEYSKRFSDRIVADDWTDASTTETQTLRIGFTRWRPLGIEGNILRRRIDFEKGFDDPGSRYDLAGLRLSHSSLDGGLTGEVRYTVTSTEVEERYVKEEDDAEVVRIVSTGRYVPVTELTVGTGWKLNPRGRRSVGAGMPQPTALGRLLTALTLTTDIKLIEMSTTNEKSRLYRLDPGVLQGPETVRGDITARHVARYLSSDGSVSIRAELDTRDALDRTYTNDRTRRKDRSGTLDLKFSRPGGTTFRVEGDAGTRRLTSEVGDNYDILERSVLGEVGTRRFNDLDIRLTGSVAFQNERREAIDVTLIRLTPSVTYRIAGRGALTASVTRTEVTASGGDLTNEVYLAEGRREGVGSEWRINGDYRFTRLLTGSLSYVGEAFPGSDVRHTLDLRVNAFF